MNIVVDYGNSAAKVGIFKGPNLVEQHIFTEQLDLKSFLQNFSAEAFIISSVRSDTDAMLEWTNASKVFRLSAELPLPITLEYDTPHTLGVDRIAAACGAWQKFPNQNTMVIDAGTCITYEIVEKSGRYLGGAISPGLKMRFDAMHTFTAKLPQLQAADNAPWIGKNTTDCMQSGVINGLTGEIETMISRYSQEFDGLKVILCGGDTSFFENKLKASIFAIPELVLSGLNNILNYNVSQ
jgi:type III pantothenate kinase